MTTPLPTHPDSLLINATQLLGPEERAIVERALRSGDSLGPLLELSALAEALDVDPVWSRRPASPEEFLDSEEFCGTVYPPGIPGMLPRIREMFLDVADPDDATRELVLYGASGWGKGFLVKHLCAYWLHVLGCLRDPQTWLGLAPGSAIYLGNASVTGYQAGRGLFDDVKHLVDMIPWFDAHFQRTPELESELRFPRQIHFIPGSSTTKVMLGLNWLFAAVDEVNSIVDVGLSKTEKFRGDTDRAGSLYTQIRQRQDSRFRHAVRAPHPLLVLIGQSEFPGDYLAKFIERRGALPGVKVIRMAEWETREIPATVPRFRVSLGGFGRAPRILAADEAPSVEEQVLDVPEADEHGNSYRARFERDLADACRQIAGRPVMARTGFMPPAAIEAAVRKDLMDTWSTWSPLPKLLYSSLESLALTPGWHNPKPDMPVYCGLDLALSGDSAAACGVRPTGRWIPLGETDGTSGLDALPEAELAFLVAVQGRRDAQVQLAEVRQFLYRLVRAGVRFGRISADSFQSTDLLQQLNAVGIPAKERSVDRKPDSYVSLRMALWKGALAIPPDPLLLGELSGLIQDERSRKIDHPAGGGKDLADALAAAYANLLEDAAAIRAADVLGQVAEHMGREIDREERLAKEPPTSPGAPAVFWRPEPPLGAPTLPPIDPNAPPHNPFRPKDADDRDDIDWEAGWRDSMKKGGF